MITSGGTTTLGLYDFKIGIEQFGQTGYWVQKANGYPINKRIMLDNGDIVKSTVDGNANDPNVDMTGWVVVGKLIILNTVNEMINTKLKDGDVVKTLGYHNIFDDGGALYVISNIATDYSIPLSSGIHAVFRDTFDIRKFGIQNNSALDQTTEIARMSSYADSRVYEIDFHNYAIMTPKTKTLVKTTGANDIQGMAFRNAHTIKNLKIYNDKTVTLQKRTVQILFCPDQNPSTPETFKLSNVIFDPYVDDHVPYTGVDFYDACCHGFMAHPSAISTIAPWGATQTNYSFEFENINFVSPAYSYNLTVSAIFAKKVTAKNLLGDYLALYLNYHAFDLDIDNIVGVYRDDLLEAGRNVVKNLIHFEPELRGKPNVAFGDWCVSRASVLRKSTMTEWWAFKAHLFDTGHTFKNIEFSKIAGSIELYAASARTSLVEYLKLSDSQNEIVLGPMNYTTVELVDFTLKSVALTLYMLDSTKVGTLKCNNFIVNRPLAIIQSPAFEVDLFDAKDVTISIDYGILRNTSKIKDIKLKGVAVNSNEKRIIEVDYDKLFVDGVSYGNTSPSTNVINKAGTATLAETYIRNFVSSANQQSFTYIVLGNTSVNIELSTFPSRPTFSLNGNTLKSNLVSPTLKQWSKTYDPAPIAVGTTVSTVVPAAGLVVGDIVQAAFTQYSADIEISAVVSAENTVTVKFKNTGASTVDLPSGTIAVKLI